MANELLKSVTNSLAPNIQAIPLLTDLKNGWYCLDSGYAYPGQAAIYILEVDGKAIIYDTAHSASVPLLLEALATIEVQPEDVERVIISHSHLDHSGGAGTLMTKLPNAQLNAHPKVIKHLIEPTALIAGARSIYTDKFDELYGEILAVDKKRIKALDDNETIKFGERTLEIKNMYGHTFDHICLVDRLGDCILAGDNFGVFIPLVLGVPDLMRIPAAPTQFAPEEWKTTLNDIVNLGVSQVFVTHFGKVEGDIKAKAKEMCDEIDEYVAIAIRTKKQNKGTEYIQEQVDQYWRHRFDSGNTLPSPKFFELDLLLCKTGIEHWMNKHLVI